VLQQVPGTIRVASASTRIGLYGSVYIVQKVTNRFGWYCYILTTINCGKRFNGNRTQHLKLKRVFTLLLFGRL